MVGLEILVQIHSTKRQEFLQTAEWFQNQLIKTSTGTFVDLAVFEAAGEPNPFLWIEKWTGLQSLEVHMNTDHLLFILTGNATVQGANKPSAEKTKGGEDLAAKTQNPVGAMYSLPFKFNFDYGADNGEATFLNIQPVIPVTVGDWNLINRVEKPEGAPDWSLSWTLQFLFPR